MQQIHIPFSNFKINLVYFIFSKRNMSALSFQQKPFCSLYITTLLPLHMLLSKNHNCMLKKHYDNFAFKFSQLSTITKSQNFFISCNKILKVYEFKKKLISAKSIRVQWCFKFVHHSFIFIWCYNQHWVSSKIQS